MFPVKKVLYATDFSSYSNQAYFQAVAIAESQQAYLTIVHVASGAEGQTVHEENTDFDYWQKQLEQIRPLNNKIETEHVLLRGDPANAIVHFSQQEGIDLIILGTHGRSGLERMLMGSVAEKVIRHAPCSVLIVKIPRRVQPGVKPPAKEEASSSS